MYETPQQLTGVAHTLVESNVAFHNTVDLQKATIYGLEKHVKELVLAKNSMPLTRKNDLIIRSSLLRDFDSGKFVQSEVLCFQGGKSKCS